MNGKPHVLRPRYRALVLFGAAVLAATPLSSAADEALRYNRDVRPILSDNCFSCHGPDANHREAGLRLDIEDEAKAYVIDPGSPEKSDLIARITADDPGLRMPPPDSGKTLSEEEVRRLEKWVEQGAPYEPYWAYVPPRWHAAPEVNRSDWPDGWIDHWILADLESRGLQPSADADPITLLRRVCFDLTGLPPTPEQARAFAADPTLAAYERLVDSLLASPAFGERMAVYWLDLVRYADTVGYHGDQDHNISPYRDYVIDALNDSLPFDQFTREQIAGDLLPEATIDQRIASGYNRLLQTSHEGGVQPKEYLAIYAADRVRNLSNVWMGATVGCAQCHDHKFDPFTITDFYSLAAFFADVDEAQHFTQGSNSLPTARPPEIEVLSRRERSRVQTLENLIAELDRRLEKAEGDERALLEAERAELDQQRQRVEQSARLTMVTQSIEPRPMRVLPRGNWLDESGPRVEAAVPAFLGQLPVGERRATRLDLANWLTDADSGVGGLTARVMVNRFWYLMFGRGISGSLDDFGGQGEPPDHPELLDNLAIEFVRSGWDVKHMMKQLAMSRAYRQGSFATPELRQMDPYNRLVARQARFRLPAEMVRDNALAVGGLLVREIGGRSVKPYQPLGYYQHLNFPRRVYVPDRGSEQWRRGAYVHWQRQFLHPMLKALDAPSREECTAQRSRSNTPLEALALLNDPTFLEAARAFASRILASEHVTTPQRLDYAFELALSRAPDPTEREVLTSLLAAEQARYRDDPASAEELLDGSGPPQNPSGLDPVQLAAWTSLCRALLNLNEAVTRN